MRLKYNQHNHGLPPLAQEMRKIGERCCRHIANGNFTLENQRTPKMRHNQFLPFTSLSLYKPHHRLKYGDTLANLIVALILRKFFYVIQTLIKLARDSGLK